jgi:hypothetical protein
MSFLDVLVETATVVIGIESKRFEPFRPKPLAILSNAYWRPVWGERMGGYMGARDALRNSTGGAGISTSSSSSSTLSANERPRAGAYQGWSSRCSSIFMPNQTNGQTVALCH